MEIDIMRLAKLARLSMDEQTARKFEIDMQNIIAMVASFPPLKGEDSELDPQNPMLLRPDIPGPSFGREEMLKNAPQVQAGCLVVPKTVDQG
jgi:aspartyl-tRNA(Asn)/glutamyl-tRNA(Gln) amidotransferase subunit C